MEIDRPTRWDDIPYYAAISNLFAIVTFSGVVFNSSTLKTKKFKDIATSIRGNNELKC